LEIGWPVAERVRSLNKVEKSSSVGSTFSMPVMHTCTRGSVVTMRSVAIRS